nr:PFL family protein [Pectinatus frisingensis]
MPKLGGKIVITINDIMETNRMITENKLDVRTITMGISLRDCAHPNIDQFCRNIYDKITKSAEFLVKTGEDIENEYGIPIIHKRVSVTPIAIAAEACKTDTYVPVAEALDKAAHEVGINFIGGFSALVEKGYTNGDRILIKSIPQALATTDIVCSSVNLGSTKAGINMDCVREMGEIIKRTAELTRDNEAIGCAKLVVFSNAPGDNPFMAGAFHGVSEAEKVVSVGVSGPGVVKHALEGLKSADFTEVAETIKRTAFKITRVGQLVAKEASKRLGVPFGIIDLSLAPTPAVGDSVAHIIEEMGIESCGAPGTTAALALLNDAVKKGGLMASSHVGGLSGAFIPVSEDAGMINAVERGSLSLEKLEAMTCVCSVGLDMIAVEGNVSASTISAIIADEAAIGMINNKTTAVRIIPVPGKKVGDSVNFGGLLGRCPIVPVRNKYNSTAFIARGGRIPAPIRSLTN